MLPPARVWVSLGRVSGYMQSHPLYLIPTPSLAAPRIALFRASTSTCALFLRKLGPLPGTRAGTRGGSSPRLARLQNRSMHRIRRPGPPRSPRPSMEHVGTWRAGVNASPRGECTITVSEDAVLAVRHRNHSAPTTSLTSDPAFDPAGPVDSCGPRFTAFRRRGPATATLVRPSRGSRNADLSSSSALDRGSRFGHGSVASVQGSRFKGW